MVPESTIVDEYTEEAEPTEAPATMKSETATVYDDEEVKGIHGVAPILASLTVPPRTMAPCVSERHMEKMSGALSSSRSVSKRVRP